MKKGEGRIPFSTLITELPSELHYEAKVSALSQKKSLKQFTIEALIEKINKNKESE